MTAGPGGAGLAAGLARFGRAATAAGLRRALGFEPLPFLSLNNAVPSIEVGRQLAILDVAPDRPTGQPKFLGSLGQQHVPVHLRSIQKFSPIVVVYHGRRESYPLAIMAVSTTVEN